MPTGAGANLRIGINIVVNEASARRKLNAFQKVMQRFGKLGQRAIGYAAGRMLYDTIRGFQRFVGSIGQAIGAYERLDRVIMVAQARENQLAKAREGAYSSLRSEYDALTGGANKYLKVVQNLALTRPVAEEDIANVFRTLAGYQLGVDLSMEFTKALADFGTTTGRTSNEIYRLALALGQVQAKSKLAGEETRQLTNAGITVDLVVAGLNKRFPELAVNVNNFYEKMRKGELKAGYVLPAILDQLREFEGLGKDMARTWYGIPIMFENIGRVFKRTFYGPLFEEMAKPIGAFISLWDPDEHPQTLKGIDAIGESLREKVRKPMEWLATEGIRSMNRFFIGLSYGETVSGRLGNALSNAFGKGILVTDPDPFKSFLDKIDVGELGKRLLGAVAGVMMSIGQKIVGLAGSLARAFWGWITGPDGALLTGDEKIVALGTSIVAKLADIWTNTIVPTFTEWGPAAWDWLVVQHDTISTWGSETALALDEQWRTTIHPQILEWRDDFWDSLFGEKTVTFVPGVGHIDFRAGGFIGQVTDAMDKVAEAIESAVRASSFRKTIKDASKAIFDYLFDQMSGEQAMDAGANRVWNAFGQALIRNIGAVSEGLWIASTAVVEGLWESVYEKIFRDEFGQAKSWEVEVFDKDGVKTTIEMLPPLEDIHALRERLDEITAAYTMPSREGLWWGAQNRPTILDQAAIATEALAVEKIRDKWLAEGKEAGEKFSEGVAAGIEASAPAIKEALDASITRLTIGPEGAIKLDPNVTYLTIGPEGALPELDKHERMFMAPGFTPFPDFKREEARSVRAIQGIREEVRMLAGELLVVVELFGALGQGMGPYGGVSSAPWVPYLPGGGAGGWGVRPYGAGTGSVLNPPPPYLQGGGAGGPIGAATKGAIEKLAAFYQKSQEDESDLFANIDSSIDGAADEMQDAAKKIQAAGKKMADGIDKLIGFGGPGDYGEKYGVDLDFMSMHMPEEWGGQAGFVDLAGEGPDKFLRQMQDIFEGGGMKGKPAVHKESPFFIPIIDMLKGTKFEISQESINAGGAALRAQLMLVAQRAVEGDPELMEKGFINVDGIIKKFGQDIKVNENWAVVQQEIALKLKDVLGADALLDSIFGPEGATQLAADGISFDTLMANIGVPAEGEENPMTRVWSDAGAAISTAIGPSSKARTDVKGFGSESQAAFNRSRVAVHKAFGEGSESRKDVEGFKTTTTAAVDDVESHINRSHPKLTIDVEFNYLDDGGDGGDDGDDSKPTEPKEEWTGPHYQHGGTLKTAGAGSGDFIPFRAMLAPRETITITPRHDVSHLGAPRTSQVNINIGSINNAMDVAMLEHIAVKAVNASLAG